MSIKKITQAAMICAISGVFLLLDRQSAGLIESLFFWIMPVPVLIYAVLYGARDGLTLLIAQTLLAFLVATPDKAILTFGSSLIGLSYGIAVYQKLPIRLAIIAAMVTSVLFYYFTMLFFASFFGYDIYKETDEILAWINGFNSTEPVEPWVRQAAVFLAPALTGILQGVVTHFLAVVLLARLRIANLPSRIWGRRKGK
ncbi:MAG: YybS family protein [Erysipelotrichaceae bacterium]|jgi:riboflavin transporter FmnP|nr:YybS family protein [Erysipelotrichaceae bacterium]